MPQRRPGSFKALYHPELMALMVTQTIGWGSSQALIGSLASSITTDIGLSPTVVYAGATVMFLTGAFCASRIGRLADRYGGGRNLAVGSIVFVMALTLLSQATETMSYLLAWVVFGIGMHLAVATSAMTLLAQVSGPQTRRNVAILALAMGLSSSISWPIASWLDAHWGWRVTCLCYASVNLFLAFPLHLSIALKAKSKAQVNKPQKPDVHAVVSGPDQSKAFVLLALGFTLIQIVSSTISVMLIDILHGLGLSRQEAVMAASLLGVSYVIGRVIDLWLGRNFAPLVQGVLICWAILISLLLPFVWSWLDQPLPFYLAVVFVLTFGIPAGLKTILRATLILHLFGSSGYGYRTGRLYYFGDFANAFTPLAAASLLVLGTGILTGALLLPAFAAGIAMTMLARLTPKTSDTPKPSAEEYPAISKRSGLN